MYKFLIIFIFAVFSLACGGGGNSQKITDVDWSHVPQGAVKESKECSQATPLGAKVFSKNCTSDEFLRLADEGISDALRDAAVSGYTSDARSNVNSFYEVYIPVSPCVRGDSGGVGFAIRADVYDGTDYDKYNPKGVKVKDGIGVILAAEMVRSVGTPPSRPPIGQLFACEDLSQAKEAVRNGVEHIKTANEDSDYFNATWYHGNGVGHPFLPKRALARTLKSGPPGKSDSVCPIR